MKWYTVQFDKSWVICKNHKCRKEFTKDNVARKIKCPSCRMDNHGMIKPVIDESLTKREVEF